MTCMYLLMPAKFEFKDSSMQPKYCPFLTIHEIIFVKIPKYLLATSSLSVEQKLVHLDRFMHFGQKVVGVT